MIRIGPETLHDFERASALEWLETNGLGGWASSTVAGAHGRRYHGLLVAATEPPVGRTVLVSKLDETLELGDRRFELGANRFPGTIHPRGHEHLESFERDLFPVFEFAAQGVRLRKTIAAIDGENTTLVVYEVLAAERRFVLELRPFFTWRGYHALGPQAALEETTGFDRGVLRHRFHPEAPEVFLQVPGASFHPAPDWYHRFEYAIERERGFDFHEDLWTPGVLRVELGSGERLGIIVSTHEPAGRDALVLLERERARREALVDRLPIRGVLARTLALAADQFVVRRGEDLRTLIAGYPWFGDWGRDTMIALPGICLTTGRHEEARQILRAFAAATSEGMLPNRFPDGGEAPEYNTVDATLWFFIAIRAYLRASADAGFVRSELLPVLREILAWHERGTRYGIRVDSDGLLTAGAPGVQLTWMDARVGDWVVTPRHGKAVEINALWYNALKISAELERELGAGNGSAEALERRAECVRQRFAQVFWNAGAGCLYDVVVGDRADASIRPNQIFALSLPFPLLSRAKALEVLAVIEKQLLTKVGLRSLAPEHPDYRPVYAGGPVERDGAYHQGTVWSWLLGPWIDALVRYRGAEGQQQARELLAAFEPHLAAGCVGTISEIFDAAPPHAPRGAFAQAWSVGEVLRVLALLDGVSVRLETLVAGENGTGCGDDTDPRASSRSGAAAGERGHAAWPSP